MSIPIVLLTDFGLVDPYVGQVKGVLHRHVPEVICIDLYHDLPPFSVASGAWMLERCLSRMPSRAVWFCVVDPGVGSERRALAVQRGETFFVGPDNGLLTPILADGNCQIVALPIPSGGQTSPTFHGRDLFAPTAAQLVQGVPLTDLGQPITDPVVLVDPGWRHTEDGLQSEVMIIDRYGNLVTAMPGEVVKERFLRAEINGRPCGPLVTTFSSVAPGKTALLVGGFGTIEIVRNQGSAVDAFRCGPGAKLNLKLLDV